MIETLGRSFTVNGQADIDASRAEHDRRAASRMEPAAD